MEYQTQPRTADAETSENRVAGTESETQAPPTIRFVKVVNENGEEVVKRMSESEYQDYAHVQRRLLKQVRKGWNQETRNERRAQRAFDDGIFQARLTEMAANHNAEMAEMAANYQALMQELAENHEASMQELDAEYQRGIDSMEAWPKFIDNCLLWAAVLGRTCRHRPCTTSEILPSTAIPQESLGEGTEIIKNLVNDQRSIP